MSWKIIWANKFVTVWHRHMKQRGQVKVSLSDSIPLGNREEDVIMPPQPFFQSYIAVNLIEGLCTNVRYTVPVCHNTHILALSWEMMSQLEKSCDAVSAFPLIKLVSGRLSFSLQ